MEYDEKKFPEPPELKKMGVPPLKIQMRNFALGILVAFIIIAAFAIIFRLKDG